MSNYSRAMAGHNAASCWELSALPTTYVVSPRKITGLLAHAGGSLQVWGGLLNHLARLVPGRLAPSGEETSGPHLARVPVRVSILLTCDLRVRCIRRLLSRSIALSSSKSPSRPCNFFIVDGFVLGFATGHCTHEPGLPCLALSRLLGTGLLRDRTGQGNSPLLSVSCRCGPDAREGLPCCRCKEWSKYAVQTRLLGSIDIITKFRAGCEL